MSAALSQRIAVLAVALTAVGASIFWLGVARDQNAALTYPPARGPAHALRLLERARRHNPDTSPMLGEAVVLVFLHRDPGAIRLLRKVVQVEPDNADAWSLLATASAPIDRPLAAFARARLRHLSPPLPSR